MIAEQRLFRTLDDRIVAESDPEAAFLVAGVGAEVPAEHEDAAAAFVAKQRQPAPNKAVAGPDADKSAKPTPRKRA